LKITVRTRGMPSRVRLKETSMHRLTTVSLLLCVAVSISCSRKPSDETISQDIQKKAAADPQVQEAQVTVESKRRTVTLKGKAKTAAVRQELETIAKEEPGVTGVDNQVSIDERLTPTPTPVVDTLAQPAERVPLPPPPPPNLWLFQLAPP